LSSDEKDDQEDTNSPHYLLFGPNGILSDFTSPLSQKLSDKQFVFTDVTKKDLDSYAQYIGRMLAHQSNCEYHRAYFPDGVSSNTKKQGHKQCNVLLLILLYLCSDGGAELEDPMGQARLSLYVLLISHMLLLKHFFRSSSISAK
jgi:hypothetical protein